MNIYRQQPSLLHLAFGVLFSLLKQYSAKGEVVIPNKIGGYRLLTEIKKTNFLAYYATGIYVKGNKKYFIKTWSGRIPDYHKYDLIQEYQKGLILHKVFNRTSSTLNNKLKVPKIVEIMQTENSISVISEFIQGKNLSHFPKKVQEKVVEEILKSLCDLSSVMSKAEKKSFPKRSCLFYVFTLPGYIFLKFLSAPQLVFHLMFLTFGFIKHIRSVQMKNLMFAHRDIHSENIIISGKKIYLLDSGKSAITLTGYDFVNSDLYFKKLNRASFPIKRNSGHYSFLKNYILIHRAQTLHYEKKYKNVFYEQLRAAFVFSIERFA